MTASEQIAAARDRLHSMTPIQLAALHDAQRADVEAEQRLSIAARRFQVLIDAGQIDLAVEMALEASDLTTFRKEFE